MPKSLVSGVQSFFPSLNSNNSPTCKIQSQLNQTCAGNTKILSKLGLTTGQDSITRVLRLSEMKCGETPSCTHFNSALNVKGT